MNKRPGWNHEIAIGWRSKILFGSLCRAGCHFFTQINITYLKIKRSKETVKYILILLILLLWWFDYKLINVHSLHSFFQIVVNKRTISCGFQNDLLFLLLLQLSKKAAERVRALQALHNWFWNARMTCGITVYHLVNFALMHLSYKFFEVLYLS